MINSITDKFISEYNAIKGIAFKGNKELAEAIGYKSANSITEITKGRQKIGAEEYRKFTELYSDFIVQVDSASDLKKEIEYLKQMLEDKEEIIGLLKSKLDQEVKKSS